MAIDYKPDQNKYKDMTPFKTWLIYQINTWGVNNFPFLENDFDQLTNYGMMMKLMKAVDDNINNQNLVEEDMTKLYGAFTELQKYINDYFDNLDIQEEIDNKLDEMAESGELADIIAQYLEVASVLGFDTKASLKSADNLVNGSITRTLGESTYNDGKGSYYKIRTLTSGDVIDDNNILALANFPTLIAEKIAELTVGTDNPIFYGADPTGVLDSSEAIQLCLDNNINKEVTFTCGTYKLESPIEISYNNVYGGINFNNSTLIDESESDYCIGVGTKDHVLNRANSNNLTNRFYNITNLKLQTNSTYGILIDRWFMNTRFDNIDILTSKNGIQIGKLYDNESNKPSDVQLSNFILTNTDMTGNYIGINVIGTDSKFSDGRIYGFKTGINANNNLIQMTNIHFLACNFGESTLNTDYACVKNSYIVMADMCYCDSYPCFIQQTNNNGSIQVTNLFIFSWHDQMSEAAIFDFSKITSANLVPTINYKNIRFNKSGYPANTQVIKLTSNNVNNSNLLAGFNSFDEIRIGDVGLLTNINKDLCLAKKGYYANNYNSIWYANWIPLGYLNIVRGGYAFINVMDDEVGIVSFKLRFNADLSINTVAKLSQTQSGREPALGLVLIDTGVYEVCFAKNKSNLSITTNVLDSIELTKTNSCFITPITTDLYNINATPLSSVDIISS